MTVDHVKEVVGRMLLDTSFRARLFSDPQAALSGYDLTDEEFEALSRLTPERVEAIEISLAEGLGSGRSTLSISVFKEFPPEFPPPL